MKHVKVAHPSQVRSVPEGELDRLLAQGWCTISKPATRNTLKQRRFRQRCRLLGYRKVNVYLPPDEFEALIALKKPGEDIAGLLMRLRRLAEEKGQLD